ncbi:DUF4340 domain-containing protein [Acetobacteraceae bacterium H6797]|nr:DUF4340 domain-containing protein [Acetobacteraceae bacterium H6797]
MKRRALLLLGTAAVASVAAAVVLTPRTPENVDPNSAGLAFPGLTQKLSGAVTIEVRNAEHRLQIKRQDGDRWVLPEKDNYPVRQDRVRELLVGLTELRLTEPRTANPELLGRLGLDDPEKAGSTALLLRVLDGAGNTIAGLIAGRRRVRTQGNVPEAIYVRRPNENQAWLAEGRLAIDADPALWLDRDIANLPRERLRTISVMRVDEPPLGLRRTGDPDGRLILTAPDGVAATQESALDEISRAFEFLTFTEVKAASRLGGASIGSSRFELTDNLAVAVKGVREDENIWITLTASGDDEAARLNARWNGWAFQVGSWKEKAFLPRLEDIKQQQPPAAPAADAAPPSPPAAAPGAGR